jgi:hypothetical protein
MVFNRATGELGYPASSKGIETSEECGKEPEWIPIWKLGLYLADEQWFNSLPTPMAANFWLKIWQFMVKKRRPPWLEELTHELKPPPSVKIWCEKEPGELATVEERTQKPVVKIKCKRMGLVSAKFCPACLFKDICLTEISSKGAFEKSFTIESM